MNMLAGAHHEYAQKLCKGEHAHDTCWECLPLQHMQTTRVVPVATCRRGWFLWQHACACLCNMQTTRVVPVASLNFFTWLPDKDNKGIKKACCICLEACVAIPLASIATHAYRDTKRPGRQVLLPASIAMHVCWDAKRQGSIAGKREAGTLGNGTHDGVPCCEAGKGTHGGVPCCEAGKGTHDGVQWPIWRAYVQSQSTAVTPLIEIERWSQSCWVSCCIECNFSDNPTTVDLLSLGPSKG